MCTPAEPRTRSRDSNSGYFLGCSSALNSSSVSEAAHQRQWATPDVMAVSPIGHLMSADRQTERMWAATVLVFDCNR